jgi:hypothetical protein
MRIQPAHRMRAAGGEESRSANTVRIHTTPTGPAQRGQDQHTFDGLSPSISTLGHLLHGANRSRQRGG